MHGRICFPKKDRDELSLGIGVISVPGHCNLLIYCSDSTINMPSNKAIVGDIQGFSTGSTLALLGRAALVASAGALC